MSAISGDIVTDQALRQGANRASADAFSELTSDEFIRIITTELTQQDPLQPSDTKALLEQINSIREIESDLSLKSSIESLVTENQFAQAGGLIGTRVQGRDVNFTPVDGIVNAVSKRGDDVLLVLENGQEMNIDDISTIRAGDSANAPTGPTG